MQKKCNGFALLIGVGNDLPGSAHDAQSFYDILVDEAAAAYPPDQVQLLKEELATHEKILKGLDILIRQSANNPEASIIIFYSGHGGRFHKSKKDIYEYYLLPFDYLQSRKKDLLLKGKLVAEKINKIKCKKLFVILDCCHAQGILSKDDVGLGERFLPSNTKMIDMLSSGEGKVVLASSKSDEVSWEKDGHGLFTRALIEGLQGCNSQGLDGYVNVLDILQYVLVVVPQRIQTIGKTQTPIINEIRNLDAGFYVCHFNKKRAMQIKSTLSLTEHELKELEKSSKQIVLNFGDIKNQFNTHINEGPINLGIPEKGR